VEDNVNETCQDWGSGRGSVNQLMGSIGVGQELTGSMAVDLWMGWAKFAGRISLILILGNKWLNYFIIYLYRINRLELIPESWKINGCWTIYLQFNVNRLKWGLR
jgi:hypothetical protein